jgi:hypothetical protein
MFGLIVLAFLLVLALLAPRFGVDSRDGKDWAGPHDNRGGRTRAPRATGGGPARLARSVRARVAYAWEQQRLAHEALWRAQRPWLAETAERPGRQLCWRRGPGGHWRLVGWLLPSSTPPATPPMVPPIAPPAVRPDPAPPEERHVDR